MQDGNSLKQLFALRQKVNFYLPAIFPAGASFDQPHFFTTIYQCNYPMMFGLQLLGKLTDGRPFSFRSAFYVQQQLVLQGRRSILLAQGFADTKKAAQLIAEMCKALVITLIKRLPCFRIFS